MPNTLHLIGFETALAGLITLASERTRATIQRQQGSDHSTLDKAPRPVIIGLSKARRAGIAGHDAHG